ncbi:DNA (cytosine-5-)-methyltransferase [Ureibacillus sp. FSL E2-3493]|uniref:DNA (cytosine-5-)-methyltransferase n=1 Tax=Ureibacillus sp. FSL E2-3493 TaxID=2921367 RepID=UPI003119BC61
MKFLDLFAGIGGFRLGMEMAGHECVGYVEWDKYARKSYEAIHETEGEWTAHDITGVTDDDLRSLRLKGIDVICGGFPCQAFSVAGKRGGFNDTRGTMFFEIARFAKQIKPRFLLLENVKGLLSHDKGNTFGTILNTLDELGYDVEWQVLNSKNFGVPQNRERVFIIGHLRGASRREVFPIRKDAKQIDIEILGTTKDPNQSTIGQRYHIYSTEGIMSCLTATDYKQPKQILVKEATKRGFDVATEGDSINLAVPGSKTRRGRVGKGVANTLDTSCNQGVLVSGIYTNASKNFQRGPLEGLSRCLKSNSHDAGVTDGVRIRKLTPRECWRLQGFPDWAFDKAREVNSDSQLYKQAGNSVTVNIIYEIAKKLG